MSGQGVRDRTCRPVTRHPKRPEPGDLQPGLERSEVSGPVCRMAQDSAGIRIPVGLLDPLPQVAAPTWRL